MDVMAPPNLPVGAFKRFGPTGPVYEVGQPVRQRDDGDWMVSITVLESGEVAECRLTDILDDPEAD